MDISKTSILDAIKNIGRLFNIGFILYKRGALFIFADSSITPKPLALLLKMIAATRPQKKTPKGARLHLALQELGSFFIKFGQMLSTRPDLVGEEIALELSKLQDNVPAKLNYDNIKNYISKSLDCDISSAYSSFEKHPIASASISEVFRAVTQDGKKVAVKVLRPNIERKFNRDLKLFFWISRILESTTDSFDRIRPVEIVKVFEETTRMEMDFRLEAAAASELKENHDKDKGVYIPEVYWNLTSKEVLTMEWIDGTPIHNVEALKKEGQDLKKITNNLIVTFLNQAYRDGFFHADLHPGNVLVKKNGDIALVDFGIMGRLNQADKVYLAEILWGFLNKDYKHVANVHLMAGYVPADTSIGHFTQACRSVGEPIVGMEANNISIAKLLTHLFKVTEYFNMKTQPQLLLIQKTTVMIEGLSMQLDPKVNMWKIAEPWIKKWASKNLGFDAKIVRKVGGLYDALHELLTNFRKNNNNCESHPTSVNNTSNYGISFINKFIQCLICILLIVLIFKLLS